MAIFTNVYGDGHTPDYEGCVLDWYEHNGYDDSDWYAICWNEEKQTIDKVLFDTTRCACSGRAEIDATPEVLSARSTTTGRRSASPCLTGARTGCRP